MLNQLYPVVRFDWETEARAPRPRQSTAVLTEQVVTVGRTNGNGFQTTDATWLNFSRFAKPEDFIMPTPGSTVTVYLDKAGFIRHIAPVERVVSPPPFAPAKMASAPATVAAAAAATSTTPAERVILAGHVDQDARGVVVTRVACLNAATAILSSGGGAATIDEVLAIAGQLEAWILR
jgi:hypothetical protein